jgi:hypothetical protein
MNGINQPNQKIDKKGMFCEWERMVLQYSFVGGGKICQGAFGKIAQGG